MFTGGLASGIDTRAMVQQLTQLERQPILEMQQAQRQYRTQISQYGTLKSKASELQDLLQGMSEQGTLAVARATSSDEAAVGITAQGGAERGSWSLEVHAVARAARARSDAFQSAQAPVQSGSLKLEVWGEEAVEVAIDPGATLSQVRDAINASGAKVKASLITTGDGTRLSVESLKKGFDPAGKGGLIGADPSDASDALRLTETSTGGPGNPLGLLQTQTARNTVATLDGLEVVSTQSTLSDVLKGVSFEVRGQTSGPVTVAVAVDEEASLAGVAGVVEKVNGLFADLERMGGAGKSVARRARAEIQRAVSGTHLPGNGAFSNLSTVGLTTDFQTGRLVLDREALGQALSKDPSALTALFAQPDEGMASRLGQVLGRLVDESIDSGVKGLENRIESLDDRIDRKERSVSSYQARLESDFLRMEQLISQFQDASARFAGFLPLPAQRGL